MKYRGVKIVYIKENVMVSVKRDDYDIRIVEKVIGYSPVGINYPLSRMECKNMIDLLIAKVMKSCSVSEKEAVKLLNV